MTNKELIFNLKKLFDQYRSNNFIYGRFEDNRLFMDQYQSGHLISHEISRFIPFKLINHFVITPKDCYKIKESLIKLYELVLKNEMFFEIILINNGIYIKVINLNEDKKVIYTDKIRLKSSFSFIYYFVHIIKKRI